MTNKQDVVDKAQDRRIKWLEEHWGTFNNEMGEVKESVNKLEVKITKVDTDVSWLKKSYWIVIAAAVGGLITGLLNLLF